MRRRALLAAGAAAGPALAQGEVNRIIVGFPPGASSDGLARLLADAAGRGPSGTAVVENRPGAVGNLAAGVVGRARPDGRTVLVTIDPTFTINPHIYATPGFDPAGFEHLALLGHFPLALLAHPETGITDVAGLAAAARERGLFYSSAGAGSPGHLGMEALRLRLGLPTRALEHAPTRGNAQAVMELLAGRAQVGMLAIGGGVQVVQEGRIRAIATSGEGPDPALPGVPTLAQAGVPGMVLRFGSLLSAPRGMPEAMRAAWMGCAREVFAAAQGRARVEGFGMVAELREGEAAEAWVREGFSRWGEVARATALRVE
jgi:tripartite-type tricarboxylate transporter receptor subunit TctC